jgi:hypothetical protein
MMHIRRPVDVIAARHLIVGALVVALIIMIFAIFARLY